VQAFVATLLLRHGYTHPDEWHQAPEVAASLLGWSTSKPWEFGEAAARSVLLPLLTSAAPLLLAGGSSWLLPALRLWHILPLGAVCHAAVRQSALSLGKSQHEARRAALAFSFSWPALVFLSRPFSNSLETGCLALTMLALCAPRSRSRSLSLGAVFALGSFLRFTFPLFALPLLVVAARGARLAHAAWLGLGCCACTLLCVSLDSAFYGSLQLTPLNALRYNLRTSNLAMHGLHPRWTHACFNLPLLALPLLLSWRRPGADAPIAQTPLAIALSCSIALPLLALSCAPHQEPRFLLPLLLPLAAFRGDRMLRTRSRTALWLLFNASLALFFGAMHQAGLPRATLAAGCRLALLSPSDRAASTIVFLGTYMAPQSLLFQRAAEGAARVIDLGDASRDVLSATLQSLSGGARVMLVMPAWVEVPRGSLRLLASFFLHFSGEGVGEAARRVRSGEATLRESLSLALYETF
jgi:phosphatidylinositol glycan class Z